MLAMAITPNHGIPWYLNTLKPDVGSRAPTIEETVPWLVHGGLSVTSTTSNTPTLLVVTAARTHPTVKSFSTLMSTMQH